MFVLDVEKAGSALILPHNLFLFLSCCYFDNDVEKKKKICKLVFLLIFDVFLNKF